MTKARIDIVDETSGAVLQTYRGIPLPVVARVCAWLNPVLSIFQSAAAVKRQIESAVPPSNKGARKRADR